MTISRRMPLDMQIEICIGSLTASDSAYSEYFQDYVGQPCLSGSYVW